MRAALLRRLAVAVAVLSVAGATRAVAGAPAVPSAAAAPIDRQVHAAALSTGGYWLVGSDGSVYPFGAPAHGSLSGQRLSRPITGAANVDWLNAAFDTAEAQQSRGVMIIWQDDPFDGDSDDDLEEVLISRAREFNKPVVLVHGDTHQYRLGKAWREAPNMIEVETYAQADVKNWVEVTIDPADPEVFSFSKERA